MGAPSFEVGGPYSEVGYPYSKVGDPLLRGGGQILYLIDLHGVEFLELFNNDRYRNVTEGVKNHKLHSFHFGYGSGGHLPGGRLLLVLDYLG